MSHSSPASTTPLPQICSSWHTEEQPSLSVLLPSSQPSPGSRRLFPQKQEISTTKFREAGAASFFSMPLHSLFGESCALDALLPPRVVESASRQIVGAQSHEERIQVFERFLLSQQRAQAPDPIVSASLNAIQERLGLIRIAPLARALQVSQDALEKRFRRVVGASPKRFASLVRLKRALALYRPGMPLTSLSFEAGYYDQPHFIREFRAMTGASPSHFFSRQEHC